MWEVQNGLWGPDGGLDSLGNPVADISTATRITYELCLRACGSGPEAFNWASFSQQFSAWQLPWLALIPALPFGARQRHENFVAIILTVGSPTLAAYSVILTVMNNQWLHRRFRNIRYPNRLHAVRILNSLQQSPLRIMANESLLSSLVVLTENDAWWADLADGLGHPHSWSLATAASIGWVIIAYVFTVVGAFGTQSWSEVQARIGLNGQSVGSAWLWLLAIVIAWLWISPQSNHKQIHRAVNRANEHSYVATEQGVLKASQVTEHRAISLATYDDRSPARDQECSPPIFNYARFLPWTQAVEEVRATFYCASKNAVARRAVDPNVPWTDGDVAAIKPEYRIGTTEQVDAYCQRPDYVRRSHWGPSVVSRFIVASLVALSLQWGTAGAAALFAYYTPTRGMFVALAPLASCVITPVVRQVSVVGRVHS